MKQEKTYMISGLSVKEGQLVKFKNVEKFIEEMCQLYYPGTTDVTDRRLISGDKGILKKMPGSYMGRPVFVVDIDGLETDFLWVYEELYDLKEHIEIG